MSRGEKMDSTRLSDHDRKIINKYTKHYTNRIESATARPDLQEETEHNKQ